MADPKTAPEGKASAKGSAAEHAAAVAFGGLTATEKSDLTPAQLAAAQYELRRSSTPTNELIWSGVDAEGVRSAIRNADPSLDYRILDGAQYPPDGRKLFNERQALMDRGFEPISGPLYKGAPRREFVPIGTAEMWARPIDVADEEFRVRIARSCLSLRYAEYYYRRCVAEEAPEKRFLPEALEYAMLVHHDLLDDTKRLMTRPGQNRDLERERGIIIALARQVKVRPRGATPDPIREAFANFSRG